MSALPSSQQIEECREFWADVARKNGWHREPFFVQVWYDVNGDVTDSVSHRDLDRDYILKDEDSFDYAICRGCEWTINLDAESWDSDGNDTFCEECS